MADYVVDASVICQYFITQMHTAETTVVVALMLQDNQLHTPEFSLSECVNVFWKHVRFQGFPQSDAEQFIEELLALPFQVTMISHLLLEFCIREAYWHSDRSSSRIRSRVIRVSI